MTGNERNTSSFAMGYRRVDTGGRTSDARSTGANARLRAVTGATLNNAISRWLAVYTFTDPVTGLDVTAQRVTPGVDFAGCRCEPDQQPGVRHRICRGSTCWASAI